MKRLTTFLFLIFIAQLLVAETVYKKVNPDGSVEFTDKESKDTEEVKIRKTQTFPSQTFSGVPDIRSQDDLDYQYQLKIESPAADETIGKDVTDVTVKVSTTPRLDTSRGDKIKISIDSQSVVTNQNSASFSGFERGSHTVTAVVINAASKEISPVISHQIHVKKHSKIFNAPPGGSGAPGGGVRPAPRAPAAPRAPQAK